MRRILQVPQSMPLSILELIQSDQEISKFLQYYHLGEVSFFFLPLLYPFFLSLHQ